MKRCQAGEWDALRNLLPEDPIFYVDIGAAEPEECSNTIGFYDDGGYGLLVEPRTELHGLIQKRRPRDVIDGHAAWDSAQTLPMRMAGGCSSLRGDWAIDPSSPIKQIPARRTQDILDAYPAIRDACRFCSIDTEGTEARVLAGIDFERFHPDVFMVEYIAFDPRGPGDDLSGEWRHFLLDNGYAEITRSWLNILFGIPEMVTRWGEIRNSVRNPDAVYK